MAGYIRQDVTNNIADGNVINSSDFDNEYNAIEAAFHATTGHTHDGTAAEGAAITKIGPTQDVVASAAALTPKTDNTVDLGSATLEYKDLYIDGVANIDSLVADTADINAGTIDGVTIGGASAGAATFTTVAATTGNITTVNATTVDTTNIEVATLKAKDGTAAGSIADTTGVVTLASSVLSTTDINAGTIDGVIIGGASAGAGSFTTLNSNGNTTLGDAVGDVVTVNGTTTFVNAAPTLTPLTASQAVFTNGSKTLVSNAITGTGNVVMSASPTLTGTVAGASMQLSSLTSGRVTYAGTSGLLQDSANLTFNGTDLTVSGLVNATTVDATNLEVTNLKAKDGTSAASIANTTGIITVSSQLNVDNLNLNGNTLSSTDVNGNISLVPNGNGSVVVTSAGTSDALRITQTGTGNAILVEDSANPDSSPFVVNADGRTILGNTTPRTYAGALVPQLQVEGVDGATAAIGVFRAGGLAPIFTMVGANGTQASPTISASGNGILRIRASGYDGANFISAAEIVSEVDGTPGTNDMPGRLVFSTTADGASTPTERMRIDSAGNVGIGNAATTGVTLDITKAQTGAASAFTVSARVNPDATVTAAAYGYSTFSLNAVGTSTASIIHFNANQGAYLGTAPTNQYGFIANSSLIGATNNFGFYSNIPSGTNRWNFYANGTAQNYFAGNTLIGTLTNTNSSALVVNGTISETVSAVQYLVASQYDVGTAPNDIPVNGYLGSMAYQDASYVSVTQLNAGTVSATTLLEQGKPVVTSADIGTGANQIPLNQYLGAMAYQDSVSTLLGAGGGVTLGTGTICKGTFVNSDGVKRATIILDLTGLTDGGTAGDIIGSTSTAIDATKQPAFVAQLPVGFTVLGGRMTCLEAPAGGGTDIDLYSATEGTGVQDSAVSALTEAQLVNGGVQALGTVSYFIADPAAQSYLYMVSQGTGAATYTAGRFLIEIFGV